MKKIIFSLVIILSVCSTSILQTVPLPRDPRRTRVNRFMHLEGATRTIGETEHRQSPRDPNMQQATQILDELIGQRELTDDSFLSSLPDLIRHTMSRIERVRAFRQDLQTSNSQLDQINASSVAEESNQ